MKTRASRVNAIFEFYSTRLIIFFQDKISAERVESSKMSTPTYPPNHPHSRHSHVHNSHCGILGLHPFADGHFGLLSHDLLMLFFDSLILLPLLVFQCRLLILKDNRFNRKVTSKCKGRKISEANWGLKKPWVK